GNKILDVKGNVVPGYTTNGTQVFNARGELVGYLTTEVKSRRVSQEIKKQMATQLPQTGEKSDNTTFVGAVILGLSSLLGLAEIDRRKKKEF
ncbi:LPXTG cell wall anchor domain-containing protein, partial [Lactobacillus sp. AN1001]